MVSTLTDSLSTIKTLLTNSWTAGNTDSITPNIQKIFDYKRTEGLTEVDSGVYVYEQPRNHINNAFGVVTKRVEDPVSIDIRTVRKTNGRAHFIKLVKEVDRIVNANIIAPDANYDILDPDQGFRDLSDRRKQIWRGIYDVILIKLNTTR